MKTIKIRYWQSPVGKLIIGSCDGKLCLCDWAIEQRRAVVDRRIKRLQDAEYECVESDVVETAIAQLEEYFSGKRTVFDIPVLFSGTDFQKSVWAELLKIPFGKTISYAELARRVGNPKAVRAVALANSSNPISIFVPCHRVISSNGKLTGYAGGLDAKQHLLMIEQTCK